MAEPTPPPAGGPPAKPPAAKAAPAKPAAAKPPAGKPAAGAKAAAPAAPVEIAAPTMKAEVRARLRKGRPARFDVPPSGGVLGRDEAAAVPVPLDGVSREHARIKWDGRGWWIEDLKSTNGTFVNGEKVENEKLQHLDVIGLGRNADVVFLLRAITEAAPAARTGVVRAALTDAEGTVYEIAVGEFTLGRSVACNVVADENAVSKVHARIERSSDQVLLEDLSSSNGTFVNGTRVRTSVLRDGDTLELARVATFKMIVEQGEVSGSGVFRALNLEKAKEDKPKFSGDWKTRYEWDPAELAAIAAAAAGQRPPELDKKGQAEPPAGPKHVVQGAAKKPLEGGKPSSPAILQPKPAPGAAKPAVAAGTPSPKPAPAAAPPSPAAKPTAAPAAAATPPAASSAEKPVPRPVKSEPPTPPVGSPPAGRPPTPAASDPASTPSQPKLQPARPEAARPAPAPPRAAPAPPASARPAAPATPPAEEPEYSATVAEMPAPVLEPPPPSPPPVPAKPLPIAAARFKSDKFAFAVTEAGRFDVGRSASVPLRVDHTTVSRRHAALTLTEDRSRVILEDLGAANGTRVNGADVKGTQELHDGDTVELGEVSLKVTFER